MCRRLLNLPTALSLLLCVASGGLFLRSVWVQDSASYHVVQPRGAPVQSKEWFLVSYGGGAAIRRNVYGWGEVDVRMSAGPYLFLDTEPVYDAPSLHAWRRFSFERYASPPAWRMVLEFPIGLLFVAFAVLPGLRLYQRLRPKHSPGLCPACGYDLRATPGRCPECGTSLDTAG